ncbi:MAG TPA: hypothetical protein VMA98_05355 [Candidatus Acidoferrales bacterium]|nr:hypothetical protein [Candidatus Acidoferrales bacterium]
MTSFRSYTLAAALLLAGCASQDVPLAVKTCAIAIENGAAHLHATVIDRSDKSMESATLRVDVYQNYRFERATVTASFTPALDPGVSRELALPLDLQGVSTGAATCVATGVTY